MSREINRPEWNRIRPQAPPAECTTTVRGIGVDVESSDGAKEVNVYVTEDGVEARVGSVQLVVMGNRVTLMQAHPPYPLNRWTVLWEGDI